MLHHLLPATKLSHPSETIYLEEGRGENAWSHTLSSAPNPVRYSAELIYRRVRGSRNREPTQQTSPPPHMPAYDDGIFRLQRSQASSVRREPLGVTCLLEEGGGRVVLSLSCLACGEPTTYFNPSGVSVPSFPLSINYLYLGLLGYHPGASHQQHMTSCPSVVTLRSSFS